MHFLARGTAIYSSFSISQSEYLVQLQTANQTPFLARLLYRRPLQHPEIPDVLIDSGQWNNLRVIRAPECDQDYATLSTVWLPIGYGSLRGDPGTGAERPVVAGDVVLPCYLVALRDIRWNQRYKRVQRVISTTLLTAPAKQYLLAGC